MIEGAVMEYRRRLKELIKGRKQRARKCHEKGWNGRYFLAVTQEAALEAALSEFEEVMEWK